MDELIHHRFREAVPFDGGVAPRRVRIEELAVLDEEQRVREQRRHLLEALVPTFRKPRVEDRVAAAVAYVEPGMRFLVIGQVQAAVGELAELRGYARLGLDREAARGQPLDECRQLRIAE